MKKYLEDNKGKELKPREEFFNTQKEADEEFKNKLS